MLARRQVGSTAKVTIRVVGYSDIIQGSMECTGKKGEVRLEYKWDGQNNTEISKIPRDATDLSPGSEMVMELENVSAKVTIKSPFRNRCERRFSSRGGQAEASALAKVRSDCSDLQRSASTLDSAPPTSASLLSVSPSSSNVSSHPPLHGLSTSHYHWAFRYSCTEYGSPGTGGGEEHLGLHRDVPTWGTRRGR